MNAESIYQAALAYEGDDESTARLEAAVIMAPDSERRKALNWIEYQWEVARRHEDTAHCRKMDGAMRLVDEVAGYYTGPDPDAEAERRYFDLADPAYQNDLRTPFEDTLEFDSMMSGDYDW